MSIKVSSESFFPILKSFKNKKGSPFTIQSLKTGKDFTFKVSRSEFNDKWYTHVWVEKNYLEFYHVGTYFQGSVYKNRQKVRTPAARAISYLLGNVELKNFDKLDSQIDIFHSGNCMSCGRELTDSESIQRGIGPVCAKL